MLALELVIISLNCSFDFFFTGSNIFFVGGFIPGNKAVVRTDINGDVCCTVNADIVFVEFHLTVRVKCGKAAKADSLFVAVRIIVVFVVVYFRGADTLKP